MIKTSKSNNNADKIYAIVHLVVLVMLIIWNYYSNTGVVNNNTVGSVSDQYSNLFTPADYAFSIWGLIYLGLIALAGYMVRCAFGKGQPGNFIRKAAPTLTLAHFGNAVWLWLWLREEPGFSLLIMIFILVMLIMTVIRLNMERWDAPLRHIAFVWWPVDLYIGWISVATIAAFASYLVQTGWQGGLSEVAWTVIAITIATILSLIMIIKRNMREFGGVVIWALAGIAVRHWQSIPIIQWAAVTAILVIGITSLLHAYQNRETLPFLRRSVPKGSL